MNPQRSNRQPQPHKVYPLSLIISLTSGKTAIDIAEEWGHGHLSGVLTVSPSLSCAGGSVQLESERLARKRTVQIGSAGGTFRESICYDPEDPAMRAWMSREESLANSVASGMSAVASSNGSFSKQSLSTASSVFSTFNIYPHAEGMSVAEESAGQPIMCGGG